jgi:hypothetical protein
MVPLKQRPSSIAMTRCGHQPPCPPATAADLLAAVVIAAHPEQGWSLLCNGVITFEDTGAIADGRVIPPHRAAAHPAPVSIGTARAV